MVAKQVRDFSKRGDAIGVPNLTRVQRDAYQRFLQLDKSQDDRDTKLGLEALLREVFQATQTPTFFALELSHIGQGDFFENLSDLFLLHRPKLMSGARPFVTTFGQSQ